VYEEDGLTLFESGAIVMHIGQRSPTLLPAEAAKRARAVTWMFAALNSVEPALQELTTIDGFYAKEEWAKVRRPAAEKFAAERLAEVATVLEGRDYLEHEFSAADLILTTVLRNLRQTPLVANMPALAAYQARCESRPAFQRALAAQLAPFARYAPAA
jgi:glutathione S-transferase